MRLHRNLVLAVTRIIDSVFNLESYADKTIEKVLRGNKKWGSRDRGFIAETSYEIIRWKRLYLKIAEVKKPYNNENLWRIFSVWAVLKGINLPDWKEFEKTPKRRIKGKFDYLNKIRKYRESIPDWIDEIACQELGEKKWEKEISALNKMAPVILRTNTLKNNISQLQKTLASEKILTKRISGHPHALKLNERTNLFKQNSFKNGLYEIQDASSQLVAPFINISPGMKICDVCAGAGGKTLHISCLTKNKGKILAMDIYENKLIELRKRARRNSAFNIETRVINNRVLKKMKGKFDRVLLDVPCTGMGVLRRNPDSKWKLSPVFFEQIKNKQQELLVKYSTLINKNGKIIYSTCSILPSENEMQIKKFLNSEAGKNFEIEEEKNVSPNSSGNDGFYMVRLALKKTC